VTAIADWRPSKLLSEPQRALLAYTDAMTGEIDVPGQCFADLRKHFKRAANPSSDDADRRRTTC